MQPVFKTVMRRYETTLCGLSVKLSVNVLQLFGKVSLIVNLHPGNAGCWGTKGGREGDRHDAL